MASKAKPLPKRVLVGPSYIKYYGGGASPPLQSRLRYHSDDGIFTSFPQSSPKSFPKSFPISNATWISSQEIFTMTHVEQELERLYGETSRQLKRMVVRVGTEERADSITRLCVLLLWSGALCVTASLILLFPQFFIAGLVLGFDQVTRGIVTRSRVVDQSYVKNLPWLNRKIDTVMLSTRALSAVFVCFVGHYIVLQLCVLAVVSTAWIMTRRGMVVVVLLVAIACGTTTTAWVPYWSSVTLQTYAGIASVNLCRQPLVTENSLRSDSQFRKLLFL